MACMRRECHTGVNARAGMGRGGWGKSARCRSGDTSPRLNLPPITRVNVTLPCYVSHMPSFCVANVEMKPWLVVDAEKKGPVIVLAEFDSEAEAKRYMSGLTPAE